MDLSRDAGIRETDRFVVDGIEFVPSWDRPSVTGSLTLLKSVEMVRRYEDLLTRFRAPRIVELGISQGGSVALLALLARPTMLVAVDLSPDPVEPLLEVLRDRGLESTVKAHFGVDQADRGRLAAIVEADVGDAPLDLVIDDASHRYAPTVASFEVLFPRLRPGGVYVIEDWTCDDNFAKGVAAALADPDSPHQARLAEVLADKAREDEERQAPREPPLSRIAVELTLARAHAGDAITEVHLYDHWIVVHRGPATLDPSGFRLTDLYPDHFSLLAPLADGSPATRVR